MRAFLLCLLLGMACSTAIAQAQQSPGITIEEARVVVKRCYLKVLHREADPGGLESHAQLMLETGCDESAVEAMLAQSPEHAAVARTIRKKRITFGVGVGLAILIGLVLFYPEGDDPDDKSESEPGDSAAA